MQLGAVLSETYFGSTIPQYLQFFFVLCIGAVLGRSLSFFYRQRLRRKVEATETDVDDIITHALGRPVVLLVWCSERLRPAHPHAGRTTTDGSERIGRNPRYRGYRVGRCPVD
jgi:hypothetical protein